MEHAIREISAVVLFWEQALPLNQRSTAEDTGFILQLVASHWMEQKQLTM